MAGPVVAMIQSSYLPWKGYFDQINMADVFVFYDDVQYTKEDWRNRNRIKTPHGLQWMTVPCGENLNRLICEVEPDRSRPWQRKHLKTLRQYYGRARWYERYIPFFESIFEGTEWTNLSELNQTTTRRIATEILGITTSFRDSREFDLPAGEARERRWVDVLRRLDASVLIAGPTARDYLRGDALERVRREGGVEVRFMDYSGYPEYRQLYPPFRHEVSIVDLVFNEGPDAPRYMLSFGNP